MTDKTDSAPIDLAYAYVRSLRNRRKRAYALAYLRWFAGPPINGPQSEPDRGDLSYMAAQAVRARVAEILKGS